MKLSFFSARAVMVLALALLAGCKDSTGTDTSVGGEYQLVSGYVSSFENGQSTRQSVPIMLYEGLASDGSSTYDIRFEVTSSTITLDETRNTFQFSGTYRLTERTNRFPVETATFTGSGTYSLDGSDLTLTPSQSSEVGIGSDAMLYQGKLSVEITDPIFGLDNLFEFRK